MPEAVSLAALARLIGGSAAGFMLLITLPLYGLGSLVFRTLILPAARAQTPRRLFALSFALSLSLLTLILLEVMDLLEAASRRLLWRVMLLAHLALLVVGLPLAQLNLLLRRALHPTLSARWAAALSLPAMGVWLYLFVLVGRPFPVMNERAWAGGTTGAALFALALSRAGVIGVTTMALMSGIGAVVAPARSLFVQLRPVPRNGELHSAERALLHAACALLRSRARLASVQAMRDSEAASLHERARLERARLEAEQRATHEKLQEARRVHDARGVASAAAPAPAAAATTPPASATPMPPTSEQPPGGGQQLLDRLAACLPASLPDRAACERMVALGLRVAGLRALSLLFGGARAGALNPVLARPHI